jgi:hypothetical protein
MPPMLDSGLNEVGTGRHLFEGTGMRAAGVELSYPYLFLHCVH